MLPHVFMLALTVMCAVGLFKVPLAHRESIVAKLFCCLGILILVFYFCAELSLSSPTLLGERPPAEAHPIVVFFLAAGFCLLIAGPAGPRGTRDGGTPSAC